MPESSETRRVTCFVSGRVQGVGFRFHTKEFAKKYSVVGTVENLNDGRVKVVAEGKLDEVQTFLDGLEGSMVGNITRMERFECDPSHEFQNFSAIW